MASWQHGGAAVECSTLYYREEFHPSPHDPAFHVYRPMTETERLAEFRSAFWRVFTGEAVRAELAFSAAMARAGFATRITGEAVRR